MKIKHLITALLSTLSSVGVNAQEINVGDVCIMSGAESFGITTNKRDWKGIAKVTSVSKPRKIKENYTMLTGKRSHCANQGTECVYTLANAQGEELRLVIRKYKDGYAFRYELNEVLPDEQIVDEATSFSVPSSANRWMQLYDGPGYEHFFPNCKGGVSPEKPQATRYGYPALFELGNDNFFLVSDSYTPESQSGTLLVNDVNNRNTYTVKPIAAEPMSGNTWHSAWHVIITGTLADVVESTLVTDVAEPCKLTDTSWIQTGLSSWIYWAYNHGSQEYSILKEYVDLAVEMKWPYTLVDAEWDVMRGGDIQQLVKYATDKGVKPMIWYNSTTNWTGKWAPTPQNCLDTPADQDAEFGKIAAWGVKGVKVDFFRDDTPETTALYRSLAENAAKHQMLINFHGGTLPHGWQRTFPNVVTCEAVYGAEWYNNNGVLTNKAACHNATLPFVRNVIGPMDYTPGTFTDSQHPHITTHGHELALPVLFESGIQHMPDRPESYRSMPTEVKELLSGLPSAWDDTKLLAGYPGKYVVMARRKGADWYVAAINGTDSEMDMNFSIKRLGNHAPKATVYTDGADNNTFAMFGIDVSNNSKISVQKVRARGGFVMKL